MVNFFADLRFALRQLRKTPVFTAIAILTLALGIGANTAVFSVMDAVLLRSLPVEHPNGLYYVKMAEGQAQPLGTGYSGVWSTSFSLPVFTALRSRTDVFSSLVAYVPLAIEKTAARVGSTPIQTWGEEVSGNFFSGLSANLALGRGLTLADERAHAPVMVISYAFWTRQFAQNPNILGQTVYVKSVPLTVIGVAARGFFGVEPAVSTDFWIPLQTRHELNAWGSPGDATPYNQPSWWCLRMMARLKPGVTPQQAQAAVAGSFLQAAKTGIGAIDPKQWKPLLAFDPARGIEGLNDQYREPVEVLMGLVLVVLLIAVTNVGTMLLARNTTRAREFSLRLALGAGRSRLLAQLVTESAILAATGAALGWAFAIGATHMLAKMSQIHTGLAPDRFVLWFTLGLSAAVALVFGLAPLRSATRAPVASVLRASSTQTTQDRTKRVGRNTVMAAQIALCLLLLVAGGLLLRTLSRYQHQSLGMQADHLLLFGITPLDAHSGDASKALYRDLLERIDRLPGVAGATLVQIRPGTTNSNNTGGFSIDGAFQGNDLLRMNRIGNDYFQTVGTRLLQGREFNQADAASQNPRIVVNESFVKRYFGHREVLGHQIETGVNNAATPAAHMTIIGVVADSRYTTVDEEPRPMFYGDLMQAPGLGGLTVEVRTAGDPMALLPSVRNAVRSIDPNLPLEDPMTQQAQFALSYAQPTMFATLGGFFGGLAALLVAAGLYGTLAYRTARRRTEIGIRMALGAQRGQVVWLVLRESLLVAALGLALGVPLALASTRLLSSMLWHLSPTDPASVLLGIVGVLMVVAFASLIPARRAASVDPAEALRSE